jgi:RNA polymerase sigma-70 factor (ECF subfamily)
MIKGLNNKKEFKDLYTEYFSIMVNFAYSKTNDWELSQEIVQNTFVKLWTRRKNTTISTSIKSYLFMMVRNAIIDNFRHNQRFAEIEHVKEEAYVEDQVEKEEKLIMMRHAIKLALENMKEKRRQIFVMSKYEGLTYAEIAEHLNISERSIEDNMAKAISKIREMLKLIYKE